MISNSTLLRPLRRSARFVPLLALHNTLAIILTPLVPQALLSSAYQATTSSASHSRTARTSFWNLCRPLVASQVARQAQHLGSSKFGRWGSQFGATSTERAWSRSGGASRGGARWSLGSMGIDWYAGRQAALAPVTVAMTSDRRGCFENAWRGNCGRGMATRAGEVPMVVGKFGRGM
ncbi:hypothetical protein M427DRAFT_56475 [Gonapodya prolifera JEL478]|uniref:Uncharacterized protein n=1 Tax=Gonapodya prolifera (strain JEL478) TaxID=1344416 RepID=A0A139AGF4_GONPJ|nr:hypothetical protein M427DRAFT_56475 [Gonapodya prolifera JEL478]|eukprot:KXS15912.1 hypothetical protein M427DRAFT_56475 [Gonapodya prolifera JEL478]